MMINQNNSAKGPVAPCYNIYYIGRGQKYFSIALVLQDE